jgi:hypothetical protein
VDRAHKLGYHFDATSAGTLQKVFDGISDEDKDVALCLELLKRKAMQRCVHCSLFIIDADGYQCTIFLYWDVGYSKVRSLVIECSSLYTFHGEPILRPYGSPLMTLPVTHSSLRECLRLD